MGTKVAQLQPPVKGLNFRSPAIKLDPQEALVLDNVLPKASCGELRAGYVDFVTGIPGSVVTMTPFLGNLLEDSRTFAFNDAGQVFDVTYPTAAPEVLTQTDQIDGIWDYTNSQGGDANYMIVVSPNGGYWTYSKADGFKKRDITGAGAGKRFSSVFNWKDRVWLIEENSSRAYYLGIGAIQGDAKLFDFGPVMNQGGYLNFGSNWTYNAGYDMDDYLVLVTTAGEVIVYKGYNPDDVATFSLQGVWYIGKTPKGNKCFTQYGGEMLVMSALGVVPVSKLVNGQVASEFQVMSANVQPVLNEVFNADSNRFGWDMETIYNQNFVMLKTPQKATGRYAYWVMNVQTGAWGNISGMPMNCSIQVVDELYFGTTDGRVCKAFTGDTDGASIDGTPGRQIIGHYMGGFDDFETPTNLKVFQLARPVFLSSDNPRVGLNMATEYETRMPTIDAGFTGESGGRFDVSSWNECVWSGGTNTYAAWCGLQGMGYYGALSISFTGSAGTQYIAANVTLAEGGVM